MFHTYRGMGQYRKRLRYSFDRCSERWSCWTMFKSAL